MNAPNYIDFNGISTSPSTINLEILVHGGQIAQEEFLQKLQNRMTLSNPGKDNFFNSSPAVINIELEEPTLLEEFHKFRNEFFEYMVEKHPDKIFKKL